MRGYGALVASAFLALTSPTFGAGFEPPSHGCSQRQPGMRHRAPRPGAYVLFDVAPRAETFRRGLAVDNLDYPSTKESFDELVDGLSRAAERDSASCPKIHFVGYSLGALLVRAYLQHPHLKSIGRVVMIGPPNHGSEIVDHIGGAWLFRAVFGAVGAQLGTSAESLPARLGPPDFEFGVIAGNQAINPFGWLWIRGENDGEVSVESTRLDNMKDFILVPENHTFMMNGPEVATETVAFLRTGHFLHGDSRARRERVGGLAGLWFAPISLGDDPCRQQSHAAD